MRASVAHFYWLSRHTMNYLILHSSINCHYIITIIIITSFNCILAKEVNKIRIVEL